MIQVNNDYYEDLDRNNMEKILDSFINDEPLNPGSFKRANISASEKKEEKPNGASNA